MKKILYSTLFAGLALLSGCTEDEDQVYMSANPVQPVLQLPENGEAYIISEASGENKLAFKWSDADFGAPTEITYKLQADKDGGDFSKPIELGETTNNFISLKSSAVNGILVRNDFEAEKPVIVLLRVTASISSNIAPITSEVIETSFTLYKLADPNDDGSRIYMVGAAVPAGWNPGDAVEMVNIAPNIYRATTTFAVDRFRFLGQKDWSPVSYNFPFFTGKVDNNFENARQADREDGDENLWFKGTPGEYTITVDLNTQSIILDAAHTDDNSRIYIVGAGVPDAGWDPGKAVEMVNIAPNVYQTVTEFAIDRFRFLEQKDWGPTSYNFPFFNGGVSSNLENARQADREDGDENLWFKGTAGKHIITVDLENKTVEIY
ncbi:SusF/SusE family outer membrane protein [Ancylomarina salipaludis]|uniref:SusF/SusE family outer membrane protein n=1 Tax=Ancylomarina salipaludis TaxID=2501299 RepID=A0A4Q1JNL3_9BACT|nr:SusE domain-containing protein [Ancylomarina salipaludis]RXQ96278.1 SusF/SusE family outer membrane protein [Ancylomarina salipaludis]